MKMFPRLKGRKAAPAKRWEKPIRVAVACAVATALTSVGVVYAAELALQEPSYDWYTANPAASEFTIKNGSDLRGLSNLVNGTADVDGDGTCEAAVDFRGKVIRQTSNRGGTAISLGGQEFTPIGTPDHPFQGTFEGGRTLDASGEPRNTEGNDDIRMLVITRGSSYVGLFGYCGEYSTLRGIYVSNAALAGLEPGHINLPTPASAASFTAPQASLEGDTLAKAQNADESTVIHDVGAVCGYTEGSVEYCSSNIAVTVENDLQATNDAPVVVLNVGGVAGTVVGDLRSCSYASDLTVTAPSLASDASDAVVANVGGVAGTLGAATDDGRAARAGAASGCENGRSDNSGLFGIGKTQSVIHVVTTGVGGLDRFGVQKEATSSAVGGIVGYSYGSIVDCSNYGMVNTNSVAATLYKDGSKSQNVHLVQPGDTTPSVYPMAEKLFKLANGGSGVGGIVGSMRASGQGLGATVRVSGGSPDNQIRLERCFNTGMVVGLARTGGIAGSVGTYAPVDACRNGKVSAESGTGVQDDRGHVVTTRWNKPMTGGIAGTVESSISNCANLSEVENIQTGYYTAGIVGGLDSPAAYTSECFACFNTGQVHVASYATQAYREAGLVGNNGGYLHDCVMRSGCVLSHDDGDAAYPNAAIGDDSWGMWSNVAFASNTELKKSEPAAVLNASHAADVLTMSEQDWVYWYAKGGYPTLSIWDPPSDRKQLSADNVSASCVELAEYAGNMEAIPTLVVMYGTGKQEKLVQNVDYYVIPQSGATAMTGDALNMYPYSASIVGIGNYQGRVLNVCKYGIGPCDLASCDVSTTTAKYNFGVPVYPEAVYVRNPAGAQLDASEFRYEIYSGATYTLTGSSTTNYVVFDSAGFVSWDGGVTRTPVADAAAHKKLAGDLTGVDYVLYNADGARIYEVSDSGATKRTYDPISGNAVAADGPTIYKSAREGVKGGGLAGYIVKVSASEGAKAVKKSSWTSGQYVIEAIDLFRDATIDEVTLEVPTDDGAATETRTWLWNSEKSTLYEAKRASDGTLELALDSDGAPIPAQVKFTGSQLKPKTVVSFAKADGTRVELAEDRSQGYTLIYGDPYTAKADLTYFNRDATPLSAEDATAPADAADDQKKALEELVKQLKGNEKAAVTVRSILGDKLTNYVHMYFPITSADLTDCAVALGGDDITAEVLAGQDAVLEAHEADVLHDFAYRDGYGVRPTVELTRCGNKLIEDVDYEVTYANNVKATSDEAIKAYAESGDTSGLASFTVKGLGNVKGSYTGYFIIATGKNLTAQGLQIEPIEDQPDNLGWPVRPAGGVHLAKRDDAGNVVRDASMVEGRDFTVSYEEGGENSSATHGNHGAKVIVQGVNKYTGTLTASFETYPLDLSDPANAWRLGPWESKYESYAEGGSVASIVAYTSVNRKVYPVVDWDAYDPETGGGISDDTYAWTSFPYRFENKETGDVYTTSRYYEAGTSLDTPLPGDYVATVDYSKQASYELVGTATFDLALTKYDLAHFLNDSLNPFYCDAQTYDGAAHEPVRGVRDGWSIEYADNVEAGTARFAVTAPEDDAYYEGIYTGSFQINAFDVADAQVQVADQLYTGKAIEPEVRVTSGDWTLVQGVDYTVTYANNTRKGTATAVVRGIGSCEGRVNAEFTIGDSLDIADAQVDPVLEQLYTGADVKPEPRIWFDGKLLSLGQDYELEYGNNRNLSTDAAPAVVNIIGKGRFAKSTASVEFRIVSACDIAQATCEIPDQAYTGSAITPALTVRYGATQLVEGTDYEVAYRRNVKAGADARAVLTGKGKYAGTLQVPFNIVVRAAEGGQGVGVGTIERFGADALTPAAFALAVAEESYPGQVQGVLVCWAHDYPSQLLAQVMGTSAGWPVLICDRDALDAATLAFVAEHGMAQALVLGDQSAVGARVQASLEDAGLQVTRLAQLADAYSAEAWPAARVAALASPTDLEGAAELAAWAAARKVPLYFAEVDGTLSASVASRLAQCDEVVVAGGPARVDARSLDALPETVKVTRLEGSSIAGECAAVVEYATAHGAKADGAVVVNAASLSSQLASVELAASRGVALAVVSDASRAGTAPLAVAKAPAYGIVVAGSVERFSDELCDSVAKELQWK